MLLDKNTGFSLETWSTQINGDCYYCKLIMCLCLLFDMEDHKDSQRVLTPSLIYIILHIILSLDPIINNMQKNVYLKNKIVQTLSTPSNNNIYQYAFNKLLTYYQHNIRITLQIFREMLVKSSNFGSQKPSYMQVCIKNWLKASYLSC